MKTSRLIGPDEILFRYPVKGQYRGDGQKGRVVMGIWNLDPYQPDHRRRNAFY